MKNKKVRNISIAIGIILVLGLIAYFRFSQSIVEGVGNNFDYTQSSIIADNNEYTDYLVEWFAFGSDETRCSNNQPSKISFTLRTPDKPKTDTTRPLVTDKLVVPQTQKSYETKLDNIRIKASPCGAIGAVSPNIINSSVTSECSITSKENSRIGTMAVITCEVNAEYEANKDGIWVGDVSGSAKVRFYKEGYPIIVEDIVEEDKVVDVKECSINSECSSKCGHDLPSCINNNCLCENIETGQVVDGETGEVVGLKNYQDYLFYLIPLAVLGLIIFIIIKLRRKR